MEGVLTSYSSGVMQLNADLASAERLATVSDWDINLAGEPGKAVGSLPEPIPVPIVSGEIILTSPASAGSISITINRIPLGAIQGFIAISACTPKCELRRINSISGTTLVLDRVLEQGHAAGEAVVCFQSDYVPTAWWDARGNNSGDDSDAIQNGSIEVGPYQLWLDGLMLRHRVKKPIVLSPSQYLRRIGLIADPTYGPADLNGAMLMARQGALVRFTAAAGQDTFTANQIHGLPQDGVGVVLRGTMPAPFVAGRVYYAAARTSLTFKLTATRGGVPIVCTSAGSGQAFCEVLSMAKTFLQDVYISGGNLPVNGAAFSIQQPAFIQKTRVDNCDTALVLNGQECEFWGFEAIQNKTGVAFENMSFGYFYGYNIEGSNCVRSTHSRSIAESTVFGDGGMASCLFSGVHLEASPADAIGFDFSGPTTNIMIEAVSCSFNRASQRFVYCHTGSPASSGYTLRNVWFAGASPGAPTAVQDVDRGHDILAWNADGTGYKRMIVYLDASQSSTSFMYPDRHPTMSLRPDGGFTGSGSQQSTVESRRVRPGSKQTGPQEVYEDLARAERLIIDKNGRLITRSTTPIDDADLPVGGLSFSHDDTPGSQKLVVKMKDSAGGVTVKVL